MTLQCSYCDVVKRHNKTVMKGRNTNFNEKINDGKYKTKISIEHSIREILIQGI